MREKMERFVLLPFAIGCISDSSIAVGTQQQPRRSKSDTNPSPIRPKEVEEEEEEEDRLSSGENMKNTLRFHALPKPNISIGIHRLFKGFKTISQIFVYKDEIDEELELDMEIGNPTDVKHVTHIGLDGSASAASYAATDQQPIKSTSNWDNLDLISPVSWRQFEFSMPSPANAEEASLANVNI